jgi:hypothetical protein
MKVSATFIATGLLVLMFSSAAAAEDTRWRRTDLGVGITAVSYGFYEARNDDGEFDETPTFAASGVMAGINYMLSRYIGIGAATDYVLSYGRSDFWSRKYEPLFHKVRFGPRIQFRWPGESVEPFLNVGGGMAFLVSKNR